MKRLLSSFVSNKQGNDRNYQSQHSKSALEQPSVNYFQNDAIIMDYIKDQNGQKAKNNNHYIYNDKQKQIRQKIDKQFYQNLLNLEEQVQNNKYDIQTLTSLIPFYATLVELYDADSDPISFYFMEKIQNVLTLQQSLSLIYSTDGTPIKNGEYTKLFYEQMNINQQIQIQQIDEFGSENMNINDISVVLRNKKKQRASKMQMFIEYRNNTKETNIQVKMDNIITDYQEVKKHNEIVIDEDINFQMERLNRRLEKRSRFSILSRNQKDHQAFEDQNFGILNIKHSK